MFKRRCFICKVRDKTRNMNYGYYGIYNHSIHYFHNDCVEEVICDPENHSTAKVDRALWCHDHILDDKKMELVEQKRKQVEAKIRELKLQKAQETWECIK